jgi:phospholipase/lecithinase/hemolysin
MRTHPLFSRTGDGFTPPWLLALCCAVLTLAPVRAWANDSAGHANRKGPFSNIVVIGDSLSDTGRTFSTIGIPPPPYYNGRVSNGPVWIEYLAPQLKLAYDPLSNFSWAGANTGRTNVFTGLPGMLDELDEFLGLLPRKADKKALYVVWGGANDFIRILTGGESPAVVIPQAVANLVQIVGTLHAAGAEHIVVVDLPDMGLTPRARAGGATVIATATALSVTFNTLLDQGLGALGIPVIRVSAFQLINALAANPAAFGFTNTTSEGIFDLANASTYLFWDDVHPTTRAHQFLADALFNALAEAGLLKQLLKHP